MKLNKIRNIKYSSNSFDSTKENIINTLGVTAYSSKAFDITNEFEKLMDSLKRSPKELPQNVTFNDINYEIEIWSDFTRLITKINENKSIRIGFETSIDDDDDIEVTIDSCELNVIDKINSKEYFITIDINLDLTYEITELQYYGYEVEINENILNYINNFLDLIDFNNQLLFVKNISKSYKENELIEESPYDTD